MPGNDASIGDVYRLGFGALVVVGLVGIAWEVGYHAAQQYRWEKDWPSLFGLLQGLPEAFTTLAVLKIGLPWDVGDIPASAYSLHFSTTWIVVWLFANGPMRVVNLRWRYDGGRLL